MVAALVPATAAHSVSPLIVSERGMPPTRTVRTTRIVRGSTAVSVPAIGLATQIRRLPAAIAPAPEPTSTAPSSPPRPMRHSIPSTEDVAQARRVADGDRGRRVGREPDARRTRALRSSSATAARSLRSTQTPAGPAATASALGPVVVAVIAVLRGSMRATDPDAVIAHTAPADAATRLSAMFVTSPRAGGSVDRGALRARRGIEADDRVVTGPTTCAVGDGLPFATQTPPAPTATLVGVSPVASASASPVAGSTASSVRASASTTQSRPPATPATAAGVRPAATRRAILPLTTSSATSSPPSERRALPVLVAAGQHDRDGDRRDEQRGRGRRDRSPLAASAPAAAPARAAAVASAGVVLEDRLVEAPQLGPRLQPELLVEHAAARRRTPRAPRPADPPGRGRA